MRLSGITEKRSSATTRSPASAARCAFAGIPYRHRNASLAPSVGSTYACRVANSLAPTSLRSTFVGSRRYCRSALASGPMVLRTRSGVTNTLAEEMCGWARMAELRACTTGQPLAHCISQMHLALSRPAHKL